MDRTILRHVALIDIGETLFELVFHQTCIDDLRIPWRNLNASAQDASPGRQNKFADALVGGKKRPERPRARRNLMPLVDGTHPSTDWPSIGYGVYDRYNGMRFAVRAIRNQRHKYVWNPQDRDELYDLYADPHEMKNLSGQREQTTIEAELRAKLMDWLAEIGDDLPGRVADLPKAGTIMATGRPGP